MNQRIVDSNPEQLEDQGLQVLPQDSRSLFDSLNGDTSSLPIHLRALGLDKTRGATWNATRLAMLTSYEAGPFLTIMDVMNQSVNIIGATFHEHPPYQAKSAGGPEWKPGFINLYLKTDRSVTVQVQQGRQVIDVERHAIIKTAAIQVLDLFKGLIMIYGWFDWEGFSVPTTFSGNKDDGYFANVMIPTE